MQQNMFSIGVSYLTIRLKFVVGPTLPMSSKPSVQISPRISWYEENAYHS